jgi:hypothetical protein
MTGELATMFPRWERLPKIKEGSRLAALVGWCEFESRGSTALRLRYLGKLHVLYLGASDVNAAIGPSHIGI